MVTASKPASPTPASKKTPIAGLLQHRLVCAIILAAGLAQVVLAWTGLPSWRCPIEQAAGLSCPGCGLTRASLALLRGQVMTALAIHPMAILFAGAFVLIAFSALLPAARRDWMINRVRAAELRFPIVYIFTTLLVLAWIVKATIGLPAGYG